MINFYCLRAFRTYIKNKGAQGFRAAIPGIIANLNASRRPARLAGLTPLEINVTNSPALAQYQEDIDRKRNKRFGAPKLVEGDIVLINSKAAENFSSANSWQTQEIFRVHRINTARNPPLYFLRDMADEPLTTPYYSWQLKRVGHID